MKLEKALSLLEGKELDAMLGHWDTERHAWPVGEKERRHLLSGSLTDRTRLALGVSRLPSRLRDLLVFVVRSGKWSTPFDLKSFDSSDLPVEFIELMPVGMALAERGLFAPARAKGSGASRAQPFVIPEEVGALLELILDQANKPVDAALSLRSYLRFVDRKVLAKNLEDLGQGELNELSLAELRRALCRREVYEARVASLEDEELKRLVALIHDHGGIIDGDTRRRLGVDVHPSTLRRWGRELERAVIGCFERAELTNNGLSCRVGWLVIFEEIVDARFTDWEIEEDEAAVALQRGPDALADMRSIAGELEGQPFKVRKTGEYYKAGLKKLAKNILSPGVRIRGREEDLTFLLDFMSHKELVNRGSESHLRLTSRWREWDRKKAAERASDLLAFAGSSQNVEISSLHYGAMSTILLQQIKSFGANVWIPASAPVLRARNIYLRDALRPENAHRYQERHKHAPFPKLATPDNLQRALADLIVDGLTRVGLIELALHRDESRPFAFRITPLGAQLLGLKIKKTVTSASGLVVNPDLEIILFPENAGPDLVQEIGRFAVRLKADYALHYAITRESVQAAAASGFDEDRILRILRDNSRHDVPQNVEYSITEWCQKVITVTSRRTYLLEAPDKTSLDRLLKVAELEALVRRRLGDQVLELEDDLGQSGVLAILKDRGIYVS